MFTNCLWKTLDLFCLLLIIPLQQENTLSTVSCISVTVQGLKSLFAVVYNAAYRKLNLWWWQETVFCCLTYVFCWNWAPVILKVSSVGAPAAVHCETVWNWVESPGGSQSWCKTCCGEGDLPRPLHPSLHHQVRFPAWLLDTVPRAELPEPQLNRATRNIFCAWSISQWENRSCSVTKQK